MSRFIPYHSYSKIDKNIDTLGENVYIAKDNRYFQLEFCVITPKILLSSLGGVRIFNYL